MAHQVLARKYRPQRFSDVIGQDHVTRTLLNALTQGRVAHGYIFSGHRGIGKTTIARILAMALNCQLTIGSVERPTPEPCGQCVNCKEISAASRSEVNIFEESHSFDVEEIDSATRRGIDDAKLLTSKIQARPTNKSKYKILILDEAHQITDAAWNALLKTLEEPPEWAVFMFATTQPEDIPQTVRSRCQHFSFHAVKLVDILGQLKHIAVKEGLDADEGALNLLAEAGDGSVRDALSIMDQAIASAPVEDGRPRLDAAQIRELMGTVPNAVFESIFEAVSANRSAEVMTLGNRLLDAGNSPAQLARQCVRYLRNAVIAKIAGVGIDGEGADGAAGELLQISADEQRRAGRTAALFSEEELTRFLQMMLRTFDELGYRQEQRFHFELGLLKLVHLRRLLPMEELLSQFPAGPSGRAPGDTGRSGGGGIAASRPAPAALPSRPAAPAPAPHAVSPATEAVSKPSFSPFERSNKRADEPRQEAAVQVAEPPAAPRPAPTPVEFKVQVMTPPRVDPPAFVPVAPVSSLSTAIAEPEVAEPVIPELVSPELVIPAEKVAEPTVADEPIAAAPLVEETPTPFAPAEPGESAAAYQRAAVEALQATPMQRTAAESIDDAEWTISGTELRVQMHVSKTMLPTVVNAAAEKIIREVLRAQGAGKLKLVLLPGSAATMAKDKKPRAAKSGSAEELAAKHPVVQEAQRLFGADIRSVIDLRDQD
ncbi:MAG: polymerase subunit gamma and tau [Acidobacteriaceae bacterium]|nr:polymerase subunit gamma and tau [Acidobacteriaceae bacterium]